MCKPTMLLLLAAGLALSMGVRPAAAAPVTPSVCDAVTGNLVANCGFENGNTSWSITTPPTAFSFVTDFGAHSGNYGVEFGAGSDQLSQTLATTVGDTYTVTFWWGDTGANNVADFGGSFGGQPLNPMQGVAMSQPVLYTEYTLAGLSAVSSSTTLEMFGDVPSSFIYLDDFSVVDTSTSVTPTPPSSSVPEPPTFWLFSAGLLGLAWFARKKYQDDGMGKRG